MSRERGFALPGLLSPTGIMAAIIVALSLSNAIFIKLYQGAQDDYANAKATLSAERDQAKADAEQAKEESDRTTAAVSSSWAAALDNLRATHPVRVLPAANRGVSNGNAGTTPGLNVRPTLAPADPASITAGECEALISDGVLDSAQLAWLQFWITSQQEKSQ